MTAQSDLRSGETFTQKESRWWFDERPRSGIDHCEALHGRIVRTSPATRRNASMLHLALNELFTISSQQSAPLEEG